MTIRDTLVQRFQSDLSDRYAFEREVGHGGMATVFLARDTKHERKVAVKVLHPELTTALGTERFLREVRIVAQLQHPNILTLIDSGEAAGLAYFVMPYVAGESLRERLLWTKQLPVLEAFRIIREVLSALSYAHGKGIVHRDIKPDNILLSDGHAMLADFGVARAVDEAGGGGHLTVGGLAIGTPAYMSPEQAAGQPVDGRSDVYAAGCVLFEMLAGRPPFVGESVQSVIEQHVNSHAPSVADFRSGLSPAVVEGVTKALQREPSDRCTAEELEQRVRVVIATELLQHATPSGSGSGVSQTRTTADCVPCAPVRKKRVLTFGALVAALFLGLLAFGPWRSLGRAKAAQGKYVASIAAMPLDHIGSDVQSQALSEGLTEEIIAQLSRIQGLKVISRTSVVAIRDRKLTVPAIAKELGVRHVLEGSVHRSGDKIRVTLQLIDARTDAHIWANSYDGDVTDVFRIREEIAAKVSDALIRSVPEVQATAVPVPFKKDATPPSSTTKICTTYDAYLEGRYWLERPTPEGLKSSVASFEKSIQFDPNYAPAYALLSAALRLGVQIGFNGGVSDPYQQFRRAIALADRAVELDPGMADGYAARGMARVWGYAPKEQGFADLKKAADLAPNSAMHVAFYGIGLARLGLYDEALQKSGEGAELNPVCPSARTGALALTALGARRPDLALTEARTAQVIDPTFPMSRLIEGASLVLLNRGAECEKVDLSAFPAVRALCLVSLGRQDEADAMTKSMKAAYAAGHHPSPQHVGMLAAYDAYRGDVDGAITWLERSYELSPSAIDFRFLDSGLFDKVRGDPKWRAALKRVETRVRGRLFGDAKA